MGQLFANLLGRAPIKKVSGNDGRVAKNEMLESFGSDSAHNLPGKVSVFDGRVAKKRRPDSGPTGSDYLAQEVRPGTSLPHAPGVRMT